ncbi:hypothetical protein [Kitasatospora sp. NPDC088351]|uniref:hypothetical protein n=1 Tax=Kitasatospora sp. NPDC088351 TaxID=3155180 RepID=UPI00341AC937
MGSERTRNLRAVAARTPRAVGTALAGLALAVGLSASPAAAATEGNWINEGGSARSPEALSAVWYGGQVFEVTRGEDNRIWSRYGGGAWQPVPGNAHTRHRPEVVSFAGDSPTRRLIAFHVGDDGFVYYNVVQDLNANRWSGWTRIDSALRTYGEIRVIRGPGQILLSTVVNNRVYDQEIRGSLGQLHFTGWMPQQEPRVWSLDSTNNFTFTTGEQEFYAARGLTNRVYLARTSPRNRANAHYTELPGGGECESVAIGRGGDPAHLATSAFDPGYAAQQNMAIGCISPNDHQLYLNRSSDGGNNWSGWAHSSGGPSPSGAAPEIHGFPGGEVFAVLSWGSETAPFKRHMIVMKRVM